MGKIKRFWEAFWEAPEDAFLFGKILGKVLRVYPFLGGLCSQICFWESIEAVSIFGGKCVPKFVFGKTFGKVLRLYPFLGENVFPNLFYEICLMALFLGITVTQLVKRMLPEYIPEKDFDKSVFRLREQGLKYTEIAKHLNAPYDTVKSIGEGRYKKSQKKSTEAHRRGPRRYDWKKIDKETLPLVKEAVQKLWGDEKERPKKVTIHAVEKLLGLPSKRLTYLPECRKEIGRYQETQEEYWKREASWAVGQLQREGKTVNWTNIRKLTNMKRKDFLACQVEIKNRGEI